MSTSRALLLPALVATAVSAAAQTPYGPPLLSTFTDPLRIAAADLSGDGRVDLAVAVTDGRVQFFRNDGAGTFLAPATLPVSGLYSYSPIALELADVDNDGDRDVVVLGGLTQAGVVVHRNLGGGVFAAPTAVASGIYPRDLAVADFDGDGWLDAAMASGGSTHGIRLLRNDGTGSFLAATTVPDSGLQLADLCAADVDGDGRTDFVYLAANMLWVIRSLGSGQFTPAAPTVLGTAAEFVSAADFDRDGDADVVLADLAGTIRTLVNDGLGNFSTGVQISTTQGSVQGLEAVDFDGDTWKDVVWSSWNGWTYTARGLGNGGFDAASVIQTGSRAFAFAELVGNGKPDGAFPLLAIDRVLVLPNTGQGGFGPTAYSFGAQVVGLALQDLDGDGRRDVVGASGGTNAIVTRRALPGGGFGPEQSWSCPSPARFAVAFVDAGPVPDVVVACADRQMRTLLGDGAGGFGPPILSGSTNEVSGFAAGDFTGDGLADVAFGYAFLDGSGYLHTGTRFLGGAGDGTFGQVTSSTEQSSVLTIGDWNGDGVGDIARVENFTLHMLLSNGAGGFTSWSRSSPRYLGLDAADVNGDGRLDLIGGDTYTGVHVYWGDGTGNLSADVVLPGGNARRGVPRDFDQDGDVDVFGVTDTGAYLLEQVSPGVFANLGQLPGTVNIVSGLDLADSNGDGRLDVVLGARSPGGFLVMHHAGVPGEAATYCTSQTSSNGCIPSIAASGTPSATATSGFTISSSNMQNNRRGMLVYSLSGRASTPFQGGILCVQAPVFRSPILMSGGSASGLDCSGSLARDWNAFVQGLGGGSPQPAAWIVGTQVTAQWWSRDPGSFPGQSNLSNAVDFAVGP